MDAVALSGSARLRVLYINRNLNSVDGSGIHGRQFVKSFSQMANLATYPVLADNPLEPVHISPRIPSIFNRPLDHWLSTLVELGVFSREFVRSKRDIQRITQIVSTFQPHVIVARYQGMDFVASWLAESSNIPVVLEINAPIALENVAVRPSGRFKLYQRAEYRAWRSASAISVVSDVLKNLLIEQGVPYDKIVVNPNGADPCLFNPSVTSAELKREFQLDVFDKIIGFTGTFRPWHGIDILVDAFQQILKLKPRTGLFLVGSGPMLGEIRNKIVSNGLSDNVRMSGHLPYERLPEAIAAMDICVAPYPPRYPFYFSPIKIMEYMAMAKPIVASSLGQITELLSDGAGFLVPPGQKGVLAQQISALLTNESLAMESGHRARERVLQRYTWEHNAQRVLRICEKVVEACNYVAM